MDKDLFLNEVEKYLKNCKYFNIITVLRHTDTIGFIALAHSGDINRDSLVRLKFTMNELEKIVSILNSNKLTCRKN